MTTSKSKSAQASGMEDNTADQKVNELTQKLQTKLQSYATLADKVKRRNLFQTHLDNLNQLDIQPESDFETEQTEEECIILKIGYNEKYVIKNRNLMEEVRGFIVAKIHSSMEQLNSEILNTVI